MPSETYPGWPNPPPPHLEACGGTAKTPVSARKPSKSRIRAYSPAYPDWLPADRPLRPSYLQDEGGRIWLTGGKTRNTRNTRNTRRPLLSVAARKRTGGGRKGAVSLG